MEDDDFYRRLQAFTGDQEAWEGFDPSGWRSIMEAGENDGMDALEQAISATDEAQVPQDDMVWASDDSAEMIFNVHKLTAKERTQSRVSKRNKARAVAASKPRYVPDLKELEQVKWAESGLAVGDVSPEGVRFVPWKLVESYPDMFIGKRNSVRAAPMFSPEALHENRVWDFYYIHHPPEIDKKPILFVPTYQFQHLLDVVNAKLEIELTIPPGKNEETFNMSFGLGNTPRPRFLGRTSSKEAFESLRESIPPPDPADDLSKATNLGRDEFLRMLSAALTVRKKSSKSNKNRAKRIQVHREWGRSIKRVQRYLGLRQRTADRATTTTGVPHVLDIRRPTAYKAEGSVLFVAIDIEAWERNQSVVTEVGIAMLDTNDIAGVAPGDGGQGWFPFIRARHIRVKENAWALNTQFIKGCADHFNFGMSEFIKQEDIPSVLEQLIDKATFVDPADGSAKQRSVVLVFHESSGDMKYFRALGYNVYNATNVLELVDTRHLHQYVTRSQDAASLTSVLCYLGIPHQHLHNAGNDAVYTLQAMIGLAVKRRLTSLEASRKAPEHHITYAEFKEKEGWTSGGEDSDGGNAVKLVEPDTKWEDENGLDADM